MAEEDREAAESIVEYMVTATTTTAEPGAASKLQARCCCCCFSDAAGCYGNSSRSRKDKTACGSTISTPHIRDACCFLPLRWHKKISDEMRPAGRGWAERTARALLLDGAVSRIGW
jgi:hypothetical protein